MPKKRPKGIRVFQLATELGVSPTTLLDKFKADGLGDKVPNNQSLMSFESAEAVRQWFTAPLKLTAERAGAAPRKA